MPQGWNQWVLSLMRRVGIPEAPLVITFLIAPLLEENLRRALLINRGDRGGALFGSALGIGLAGFAVLVLLITFKMNVGSKLAKIGHADEKKDD